MNMERKLNKDLNIPITQDSIEQDGLYFVRKPFFQ